eukprot:m.20760 g.20760  ORF g.20760 m.20760 type:complete len:133 (+) comp12240_c0_seq1:112-510(+)
MLSSGGGQNAPMSSMHRHTCSSTGASTDVEAGLSIGMTRPQRHPYASSLSCRAPPYNTSNSPTIANRLSVTAFSSTPSDSAISGLEAEIQTFSCQGSSSDTRIRRSTANTHSHGCTAARAPAPDTQPSGKEC